jgi:hypothetical protein
LPGKGSVNTTVARRWLRSRHVIAITNTQTKIDFGSGVFCAVRARALAERVCRQSVESCRSW